MTGFDAWKVLAILLGWYLAQTYAKHPDNRVHVVLAMLVVTVGVALVGAACYAAGAAAAGNR